MQSSITDNSLLRSPLKQWTSRVLPPTCSTQAALSPKPRSLPLADPFLLCATYKKGQLWKNTPKFMCENGINVLEYTEHIV